MVEPESFAVCPVLLVHPAEERWTPASLSMRFAARIRAPPRTVAARERRALPAEQPGLDQWHQAVTALLVERAGRQAAEVP